MNLFQWLNRQMRWSTNTFGEGKRTEGVLKHIEKEIAEVRKNPDDLYEWLDIVMLALDGARRAGFTPHQICQGLERKQEIVMLRTYPKTSEDQPSEHVRDNVLCEGRRYANPDQV